MQVLRASLQVPLRPSVSHISYLLLVSSSLSFFKASVQFSNNQTTPLCLKALFSSHILNASATTPVPAFPSARTFSQIITHGLFKQLYHHLSNRTTLMPKSICVPPRWYPCDLMGRGGPSIKYHFSAHFSQITLGTICVSGSSEKQMPRRD